MAKETWVALGDDFEVWGEFEKNQWRPNGMTYMRPDPDVYVAPSCSDWLIDWLSMVLRLRQHNIGYAADGFYRSDDPTNSVKALKEGG